MVFAENTDQPGIAPFVQGVHFFGADYSDMIHKFIDSLFTDTFILPVGTNADGMDPDDLMPGQELETVVNQHPDGGFTRLDLRQRLFPEHAYEN